jgi:MerR family transcriptional regulator, light-induced transcriptional regulator
MYLNYEILLNGYKTIYLGESVPIESLKYMKEYFDNIIYVSYLTVQPVRDEVNDYLKEIASEIMDANSQVWILGRMTEFIDSKFLPKSISVFNSIPDLVKEL